MAYWIREVKFLQVDQAVLTDSKVLPTLAEFLAPDNTHTLRAKRCPTSLIEELTVKQRKWAKGDYDVNPNRGLLIRTTHNAKGVPREYYILDKKWKHYIPANQFGNNGLVNGQIWYSRLQLMRDGAHGHSQAGISGTKDGGTYSVVMGYHDDKKHEYYADIDQGEIIYYYGTALKETINSGPTNLRDLPDHRLLNNAPTLSTMALKKSLETGKPVRVIRSWKLASTVSYRPAHGEYRYDGLYRVIGEELMKEERQIWRFKMERLRDGQGPLRK